MDHWWYFHRFLLAIALSVHLRLQISLPTDMMLYL